MSIQENVVNLDSSRAPAVIRSDRLIGTILADEGKITPDQIDRILRLQKDIGVRFGEAAVQLGLITDNDVRFALAKQFDFPLLVPDVDSKGIQPSKELVAAFTKDIAVNAATSSLELTRASDRSLSSFTPCAQFTRRVPFTLPSAASASNSGTMISVPIHVPLRRMSLTGMGAPRGSAQLRALKSRSIPFSPGFSWGRTLTYVPSLMNWPRTSCCCTACSAMNRCPPVRGMSPSISSCMRCSPACCGCAGASPAAVRGRG